MDGEFFKNHPIFSLHSDALQLFGYYDDLEIANPLGSKAKIHKIGMYNVWAPTMYLDNISTTYYIHFNPFSPRPATLLLSKCQTILLIKGKPPGQKGL